MKEEFLKLAEADNGYIAKYKDYQFDIQMRTDGMLMWK